MKSCYIFSDKNLACLQEIIATKFKKVEIFKITPDENDKKNLINLNEKEFFLKFIDKFEELKERSDFIIVVGCEGFSVFGKSELNLKLARNLNAPVFDKNASELRALNLNSKLLITDKFDEILSYKHEIITPFKFQSLLLKRAKAANKTVVLPESDDERILKAAHIVLEKGAANIILLGLESEISKKAATLGLNLSKAKVLNPAQNELTDKFAKKIYELRKHKGVDEAKANALAKDKIYFATMLIHEGIADALVSGATMSTADTIRPALQIIKTKPNVSVVSGAFFMALEEEILLFADCAVTPNPSADELASITLSSAQTASAFGLSPKIAMLSYSTADSGSGADVEFVKEAAKKASELDANLKIAAPIQFDAAVDLSVASKKMPNSDVAGQANVFIFPNLNCGNICYKAVQRSANALAVGPILQGLKKPVNDLSRGCLVEDVVNTILISAIQAGE
ncbi:Phosphate acetyltransferase [Campylobacter concisus UNSWCS]|uniref:Phosphate acetyltransferase n=1 Tax=Campylobacter concisus UNSWCS TaxID=1242968 RepID=U2EXT4_9BACT|nr:phosphate acetyltransferase [Campylobacter concisus]ERJ28981.1 Phosphate acetyltransferase [Campylobacter concisus UNSWCS]